MDKLSPWTLMYHQWKSLRSVPFRRRWFVGYDLEGNSFWEFRLSSQSPMRRMIDYRVKHQGMIGQYSQRDMDPRWSSWLRFTRPDAPTLDELLQEKQRRETMKVLAARADARWKEESILEQDKRILMDISNKNTSTHDKPSPPSTSS